MKPLLLYTIINPWWVLGFADGEACFHVSVVANPTMKLGNSCALEFSITQHVRDRLLLEKLIGFFGCGYVVNTSANVCQFRIRDRAELANNLFPFFDAYPLLSVKSLDYADFKRVHALLEARAHLTTTGLDEIRTIQAGMNRARS
jgi:hypothetical protein